MSSYAARPKLSAGREPADLESNFAGAGDETAFSFLDMSYFSRRTMSSSGSSYPSLLLPRHRSIEDSLLLIERQLEQEEAKLQEETQPPDAVNVSDETLDDEEDDEDELSRGGGCEFPTNFLEACGISDQVPPPKEVINWMQEQVDEIMERRRQWSQERQKRRRHRTRQKVRNDWGVKPTTSEDDLSACSTQKSSLFDSSEEPPQDYDPITKLPRSFSEEQHLFVDSGSTSWEATDTEDCVSVPDPQYLPGPAFRKAAPHSHRESTKYTF